MGTKTKLSRIMNSFSKNERKLLESIQAPIGLDIRSRTVEKIAISVAVEMIKVKNAVRS
jgi:xanthine dehydrogenase accessory factor